jgi:hypothetical protein
MEALDEVISLTKAYKEDAIFVGIQQSHRGGQRWGILYIAERYVVPKISSIRWRVGGTGPGLLPPLS